MSAGFTLPSRSNLHFKFLTLGTQMSEIKNVLALNTFERIYRHLHFKGLMLWLQHQQQSSGDLAFITPQIKWSVHHYSLHQLYEHLCFPLSSPHANRHAGDISFTVCLSVCLQHFYKGYLQCGLMQGDEIWQDGTPGWVTGHLPFGDLWPRG